MSKGFFCKHPDKYMQENTDPSSLGLCKTVFKSFLLLVQALIVRA
uniref:Uncharacterized protein n=1 Tax=Manihot esculenta TaxID=3983 RepID=A0A2C9UB34_MANES